MKRRRERSSTAASIPDSQRCAMCTSERPRREPVQYLEREYASGPRSIPGREQPSNASGQNNRPEHPNRWPTEATPALSEQEARRARSVLSVAQLTRQQLARLARTEQPELVRRAGGTDVQQM